MTLAERLNRHLHSVIYSKFDSSTISLHLSNILSYNIHDVFFINTRTKDVKTVSVTSVHSSYDEKTEAL